MGGTHPHMTTFTKHPTNNKKLKASVFFRNKVILCAPRFSVVISCITKTMFFFFSFLFTACCYLLERVSAIFPIMNVDIKNQLQVIKVNLLLIETSIKNT